MSHRSIYRCLRWQILVPGGQGMLKGIFVTAPMERMAHRVARTLFSVVLAACTGSLAGCASSSIDVGAGQSDFQSGGAGGSPKAAVASATGAGNYGYTVGAMDVLDISVFKVPELSKSVQVADTGTINIPLLGEVPAAGKTAQEIEQDLTRKLGAKYLKNPQVTVFVRDHNSQMVTIEGAVMKPGVFPIRGKLSLVQLVATAGGLNNDLYDKNITVFSTIDGTRSSKVYNVDEIRNGKAADPELHQGDIVVVDNNSGKVALNTTLKVISPALSVGAFAAKP
jgi:polysaccharide biosynthesis/export protein